MSRRKDPSERRVSGKQIPDAGGSVMRTKDCFSNEILARLAEGMETGIDQQVVNEHLLACAWCRSALIAGRRMSNLVRREAERRRRPVVVSLDRLWPPQEDTQEGLALAAAGASAGAGQSWDRCEDGPSVVSVRRAEEGDRIIVVVEDYGDPVRGRTVTLRGPAEEFASLVDVTDENGTVVFEAADRPPGHYEVVIDPAEKGEDRDDE